MHAPWHMVTRTVKQQTRGAWGGGWGGFHGTGHQLILRRRPAGPGVGGAQLYAAERRVAEAHLLLRVLTEVQPPCTRGHLRMDNTQQTACHR